MIFFITDSSAKLSINAFFFFESAVSYNDLGKWEPKFGAMSQSHKMEVVNEKKEKGVNHFISPSVAQVGSLNTHMLQ